MINRISCKSCNLVNPVQTMSPAPLTLAACNTPSPETAQSLTQYLPRHHSRDAPTASKQSHSQHSPCSRRFSARRFQSKQIPPLSPRRAYQRLSHRNEWRSLSASFIFRHHVFTTAENLAHDSFLRH